MKTREQCKGMTDEEYATTCAKEELMFIQSWLKENDWKVNKIIVGEWTADDERWLEYLEQRTLKRARQDELLKIINKNY